LRRANMNFHARARDPIRATAEKPLPFFFWKKNKCSEYQFYKVRSNIFSVYCAISISML